MKPNYSGPVRVASNFARLLLTFIVGIFVVRLLLRFGDDAYGLIALLGTGTGVALIFKEVVRFATVPILGEAFHSKDSQWFAEIYNSAIAISLVAGLASLAIFAGFAYFLPLLNFPDELYFAALIFVLCNALQSFFTVSIAPLFNFYVVSERMVAYNFFLLLERLGELVSALLTLAVLAGTGAGIENASTAIICYGICNAVLSVSIHLLAATKIIAVDNRLRLNFHFITRRAIKTFLASAGWNGCVIVAMSLYAKADALLMNLFFGLFGNMSFILANQSVSYVRSFIIGFVSGLDAVASRMVKRDGEQALLSLMHRSTALQAIVVLPAFCGLLIFAKPLIELWLQGRIQNPNAIPAIVSLIQIMIIGVGARCLSEGWIWIMNGAGKVKSYAPFILVGGVLNPIIAWIGITVAPDSWRFFVPAYVFSCLMTVVHLIGLPLAVAREFEISVVEVVRPLALPCLTCGVCLLIAFTVSSLVITDLGKLVFAFVFAATYLVSAYFFLLATHDRKRISAILLNRFSKLRNGTR